MKPAGGIRNAKQALAYLVMVKETLGDDWLTPDLFRFGASTLVNDVLMQIVKTVDEPEFMTALIEEGEKIIAEMEAGTYTAVSERDDAVIPLMEVPAR